MRKTDIDAFDRDLREARGPVLVVFYSEFDEGSRRRWRALRRSLRRLEGVLPRRFPVLAVDIDDELELADELEVVTIPCALLFRDGMEVDRRTGAQSTFALCKMVARTMGPAGVVLVVAGALRSILP